MKIFTVTDCVGGDYQLLAFFGGFFDMKIYKNRVFIKMQKKNENFFSIFFEKI